MSFLSKLFGWVVGGTSGAEKVLDSTISGIDKLVLTEEERKDYFAKAADQWLELQKLLGEETSVRGVTRRVLAVMCVGTYIGLSLFSVGIFWYDVNYANFVWTVANGQYGYITLAVVGFYFGPYFIQKLLDKRG